MFTNNNNNNNNAKDKIILPRHFGISNDNMI